MIDGQPMVLPVNYAVSSEIVIFRTGEGSKLEASHGARVAFEIDAVDETDGSGWSVVVQGVAEEIADSGDWLDESLRAKAGPTCIAGPADHCVRFTPDVISGRRLPAPTPSP